jgi:hypothetical protein
MTTGFTTGTIVGDARQRDRRAVLGVRDRQVVELGDVLARGLRQAQLDVDLLAVGRGPVGRDVAVDIGAQARGELHRRQAELAHGVALEADRVGRDARLHRCREIGDAGHFRHPRLQLQDLGLETAGSGPSSETKIGRLPSVTSIPGIGSSALRIAFSTSRWLSFLSCGLTSWSDRTAELRRPLPVSPMVVETIRISFILRTTSSTWSSLSLPRCKARADRQRHVHADVAVVALRDELGADQRRDRDRDDEAGDAGEDDDRARRDRRQAPASRRRRSRCPAASNGLP